MSFSPKAPKVCPLPSLPSLPSLPNVLLQGPDSFCATPMDTLCDGGHWRPTVSKGLGLGCESFLLDCYRRPSIFGPGTSLFGIEDTEVHLFGATATAANA